MEKAGFTNITRFDAVDGFYTDDEFFQRLNILSGSPGKKGCAASHLVVWYNFFNSPSQKKFLFVCEDDMLPHTDFAKLFPFYWKQTKEDFDILLVGNQMDAKSNRLIVREPSFCTHAYIVSKRGAKKLYDLYMKLPKDSFPHHVIDIFLIKAMADRKIDYYCYNGKMYPDSNNQSIIWAKRDNGICFQNRSLGSSIYTIEISNQDHE